MPYLILDSVIIQNQDALTEQFAFDVLMGFSAENKNLPSKYFYDERGSQIFEEITYLDEYYLTRCEYEILSRVGTDIAEMFKEGAFEVIELGAGDGRKTKVLLSKLLEKTQDFSYSPIDISESAMTDLMDSLAKTLPELTTRGIVGEYFDSIHYLENISANRKLVLFLGSSIGNFDFPSALRFLHSIWKCLNNGDLLLIGFDMKKDINVLSQAYNDSKGLTRDFNLNLLSRINTELQGQFELSKFMHYGLYNSRQGSMESYLLSMQSQHVHIGALEKTFKFKAFEAIHLEVSYKYLLEDIEKMATNTGFEILANWQDKDGYFTDSLWQVNKGS